MPEDSPRVTPAAAFAGPGLDGPDVAELLACGRRLAARAEDEGAKRLYLDVLKRDPTCLEALLELSRLALRSGHRSAAITCCRQAIFCHPEEPAAHVNLGELLIESGEFAAARAAFAAGAGGLAGPGRCAPGHGPRAHGAWRSRGGRRPLAPGLADGWLAPQPYRGAGPPVPLLLLVSARGGNIPTRALLDDTIFAVTVLYAEGHDPAVPLPRHAVIFNAIGDADLCADALAKARRGGRPSAAPVINAPAAVSATGTGGDRRATCAASPVSSSPRSGR